MRGDFSMSYQKSPAELINQNNYLANFGYTVDVVPNDTFQNDSEACRKWRDYINSHINAVQSVWLTDTNIEQVQSYVPIEGVTHPEKLPLKSIAKDEQKVDWIILNNIDQLVQIHDRSRFSDDEFYPMANKIYSSRSSEQPSVIYDTARILHYNRNAHHLEHYQSFDLSKTGIGPTPVQMKEEFIWELLADWLSDVNLTKDMPDQISGLEDFAPTYVSPTCVYSPNPFFYYWRSAYKFYYDEHRYESEPYQVSNSSTSNTTSSTSSRGLLRGPENPNEDDIPEDPNPRDNPTGPTPVPIVITWRVDIYQYYTREYISPKLPNLIPINRNTQSRLESILDRWQPLENRPVPVNLGQENAIVVDYYTWEEVITPDSSDENRDDNSGSGNDDPPHSYQEYNPDDPSLQP